MKIPHYLYPKFYCYLLANNQETKIPLIKYYSNFKENENIKEMKETENKYKRENVIFRKTYPRINKGLEGHEIIDFTSNFKTDVRQYNIKNGWSNAWRKMYEICERTKFLPRKKDIRSLDICGFPGTFSLAINHYLKTKTDNENFDWYIQSYSEKGIGYLKDQYGLVKRYPEKFLINDMGDITDSKEIDYLKDFFKDKKCDIATSDCGLPNQISEEEYSRETQMTKIFFGQYLAGVSVLRKGGNFVMKYYHFYENFNISLIYLMSLNFRKVYLLKPESSRQFRGAEIYILCLGFKDNINESKYKSLIKVLNDFDAEKLTKSLISYTQMEKEILNKIEYRLSSYYRNKFRLRYEKWNFIDTYIGHDIIDDTENYFKKRKILYHLVKKKEMNWYRKYFDRMNYKRIKNEDKIL